MAKLLYTHKHEGWEKNWCGHEDERFGVMDKIFCVTYYGLYDDGTWEPLYRYCPWEDRIILSHNKGVRDTTREHLIEVVEKLYYSGKYRTMQLLIGD